MIYLDLFFSFLKIGLFSFGGAYGAIPLIRDEVLAQGWMDQEMCANMIAISESTPGPIMVNTATYVGNLQGGVLGAVLATLGVVLPAFAIVIGILAFFQKLWNRPGMQRVLLGVKPCLMGVIIATGLSMLTTNLVHFEERIFIDFVSLEILITIVIIAGVFYHIKKKSISPIALILVCAVMGAVLY